MVEGTVNLDFWGEWISVLELGYMFSWAPVLFSMYKFN
jgi:hypothetical protein